jgi:hypothetical protein
MSLGTRWLALGVALTLVLSAVAADTKTDKGKKDTSKEKLHPLNGGRPITVRINRVDAGAGALNIQIGGRGVDVVAADELKIRSKNPPSFFDEKGNIKTKPSKEDLAKAKGDPKLPGYNSDFESLKPGMVAEVWLAELINPGGAPPPKKKKDKDAPAGPDTRVRVTMILHH